MPIKSRYWKNAEKSRSDWKKYGKKWRANKRKTDPEWAELERQRLALLHKHPKNLRTIRFEVFVRDNFTCQYCGRKAPNVEIVPDHKIPKSKGGENTLENLVTACWECNLAKSDKIIC